MIFLFISLSVFAQEFLHLTSEIPFNSSIEVEGLVSSAIRENSISLSQHSSRFNNSKIGAFTRSSELNNDAKSNPHFYNVQFGFMYKHYLKNNQTLGMSASYGSASDKPFKNHNNSVMNINLAYKYDENWIWLGNYSNNRTFLNNVPLPGLLYVVEQSRQKSLMLGFPLIYALRPILNDALTFKYVALLPYTHRLRLYYNQFKFLKPYLALEQGVQAYMNSEIDSKTHRIFWFERRASIGGEKSFGPFLKIDLQVGNSFDREFFSARSMSKDKSGVVQIRDGIYGLINLKSSF